MLLYKKILFIIYTFPKLTTENYTHPIGTSQMYLPRLFKTKAIVSLI